MPKKKKIGKKTNFPSKAFINGRYIFIPKGVTIYYPVEKDEKIEE